MAKSDVKVIGSWASPFVLKVRVALNVKSVEYEYVEDPMHPKSELLLKSNPVHKKVPVLLHHDKPVCESNIIVEYINDAFASSGQSLLPSDPYDRAFARFWAAYIDEKITPYKSMRSIAGAADDDARKAAVAEVEEGLALLEEAFHKMSRGMSFFGGDHIGYLDIVFGGFLGWLRVTERMTKVKLLNETKTPGLLKWAEKFSADPAVKDVLPETEKLAEFGKVVIATIRASAAAE